MVFSMVIFSMVSIAPIRASLAVEASARAATAHAGAAPPIDKRELDARGDFMAGRYDQALGIFTALYEQTGDPILLRNMARCQQRMEHPDAANTLFRDYLAKGVVGPREREEIVAYIREMDALKQQQRQRQQQREARAGDGFAASTAGTQSTTRVAHPINTAAAAAVTAMPVVPPAALAPTAVATTSGDVIAQSSAGRAGRPGMRVAGVVVGAGGAVLLAGGLLFGRAARSAGDDVSAMYSAAREREGKRDQALQFVGYGLGAAALLTGATLYWYGARSSEPTVSVAARAAPWPPRLLVEGSF
jgi:hypothetical protein